MKAILKNTILLTTASIILVSSAYASRKRTDTDYDSNYYESEGAIIMKFRGQGIFAKSKPKKYPEIKKSPKVKEGNFITNGYGIQGATSIFFTDNFGAELGLSAMIFRTSDSALKAAQANYGNQTIEMKRKNTVGIPLELLGQYHIAPYGALRPYLGAGYHYTYFWTQSRQFKVSSTHGYVGQVGMDFVLTDDSMINIDLKYYKMQPKVTYKKSFIGKDVSGRAHINPIVFSVGMGFKF